MTTRTLGALATFVLLHAFVRYVIDPRAIDGAVLRVLLSIWFVGLGVTYTLTWMAHPMSRRLLLIWSIGSAMGFLLDNIGILTANPPSTTITALNWMGVGLGMALAVVGYTTSGSASPPTG